MQSTLIHFFTSLLALCSSAAAFASGQPIPATVYFPMNSMTLPSDQSPAIARLLCILDGQEIIQVVAVGYAGSYEAQSLALSRARAAAVLRAFEALGIPEALLYSVGKGSQEPTIYSYANQRVEIDLVYLSDGRQHWPTCSRP